MRAIECMAIFHKIVQALAVAVTMITVTAVAVAVTMVTVTAVAVAVAMVTVGVAVAVVAGGVACSHHLLKLSLLLGRELRQVNATGIHGYEKDDRGSGVRRAERLPRQNAQVC